MIKILQVRYKFDSRLVMSKDHVDEHEESILQMCDKIGLEDVSILSMIETPAWIKWPNHFNADAYLLFDHSEDATVFQEHYPEMVIGNQTYVR